MKSYLYRLSLLGFVLSVFAMNAAVADDVAVQEINTGRIAVSFDDLNLAKPAGLASLHHRVELAARRVCGVENMKVSLDIVRKNRACVSSSVDHAMGRIYDAKVTALYQVKVIAIHQS